MLRKLWSVVKITKSNLYFHISFEFPNMSFYAVAKGRTPGIFMSWADCEAQVKGFSGAKYKKFDTVVKAQEFININRSGNIPPKKQTNNFKTYNSASTSKTANSHREYSKTSNSSHSGYQAPTQTKPSREKPESDDSNGFPDSDLNEMLTKQLDDVEKRLKVFEKNIDKIIEKGTKNSKRTTILIEQPQPTKKRKEGGSEFNEDNDGFVNVYTDGACSGNGRKIAKAGLGVYWSDNHPLNISEPVSGRATNNCGEIQAATKAIKVALQNNVKKLSINTDSKFLINAATKWMPGWKRKGWKLQSGEPVKNEIDFKDLDSVQNKLEIKWNYVEAHKGIHGNEMADQLAKAGAAMYSSKE